jgi:hypothetical protein
MGWLESKQKKGTKWMVRAIENSSACTLENLGLDY